MKQIILIFALMMFSNLLFAQEIEFGKVTKEELQESKYPLDSSANASILYKNQNTYFVMTSGVSSLVTEMHVRLKIYNKEGFDYATERINLFNSRYSKEKISKIKAYTYNLEQGEIVKSELDKDQIFETEINYNYDEVKFTMPNVKEGSVIEFQYKLTSPFIWNIDEFRFQYDIPIKQLLAEIRTPEGFSFKQTQKGYLPIQAKRDKKTDNRLGMSVDIFRFEMNNVPALKEESYVDNINNYRSGVLFELVSVEYPGYYRSYANSWSDVAKTIGNSDDYKKELDKTKFFDDDVARLIEGKSDKFEKMNLIFKYVKDNVKWNGMDGKYFYNGFKKSLAEKKGNAADINLLLVAMLRSAGIKANPVIISTKDNLIPFFPTIDRLNYVIAYAIINDEKYFLDATEEFSDINILPIKDYNWNGILIDNENMIWDLITIKSPDQTQNAYSLNVKLNANGELEGEVKTRFTNHGAYLFRRDFKNKDLETHITNRENGLSNIEISNYDVNNAENFQGYVTESFKFFDENASEIVNDKIYLRPLSFLALKSNPFKEETREYPIDFGFSFKDSYSINVFLPEGYTIESLPESVAFRLPEELGSFKYITRADNKSIQLLVNFEISKAVIPADKYPMLKEYFSQIIKKETEQIVITKI